MYIIYGNSICARQYREYLRGWWFEQICSLINHKLWEKTFLIPHNNSIWHAKVKRNAKPNDWQNVSQFAPRSSILLFCSLRFTQLDAWGVLDIATFTWLWLKLDSRKSTLSCSPKLSLCSLLYSKKTPVGNCRWLKACTRKEAPFIYN